MTQYLLCVSPPCSTSINGLLLNRYFEMSCGENKVGSKTPSKKRGSRDGSVPTSRVLRQLPELRTWAPDTSVESGAGAPGGLGGQERWAPDLWNSGGPIQFCNPSRGAVICLQERDPCQHRDLVRNCPAAARQAVHQCGWSGGGASLDESLHVPARSCSGTTIPSLAPCLPSNRWAPNRPTNEESRQVPFALVLLESMSGDDGEWCFLGVHIKAALPMFLPLIQPVPRDI